jgi:hypothetical protein
MTFLINPGTETQENTTEENSVVSAEQFVKDLGIEGISLHREEKRDNRGWYGFIIEKGDTRIPLDIPGVDPKRFLKGEPFYSPRCYVDGSSWLYGFGINIARGIFDENA